jgi:hypothetical protein
LLSRAGLNRAKSRMRNLEPDPDGPDLFGFQWRLGSNQLASVPVGCVSAGMVSGTALHCSAPKTKPPAMNLGRLCRQETHVEHSSERLPELTEVRQMFATLCQSPSRDPFRTFPELSFSSERTLRNCTEVAVDCPVYICRLRTLIQVWPEHQPIALPLKR